MVAKDFRKMARENLNGKWKKAVLIVLAYMAFSYFITFVMKLFIGTPIYLIIAIAYFIISIPLSYSLAAQYLRLSNGEDVHSFDFVKWTLSNVSKSWKVMFRTLKKLSVPFIFSIAFLLMPFFINLISIGMDVPMITLLFSIIGSVGYYVCLIWLFAKAYYYSLVVYIMEENSDFTSIEIVDQSEKLMQGHRWKYFCLACSFIGWAILCCFTFGIGVLFLMPYMQMAMVAFYKERAGQLTTTSSEE